MQWKTFSIRLSFSRLLVSSVSSMQMRHVVFVKPVSFRMSSVSVAAYKTHFVVLFVQNVTSLANCRKVTCLYNYLLCVFCLNTMSAIRFTDTLADGCENGHMFCKLFFVSCTEFNVSFCCVLPASFFHKLFLDIFRLHLMIAKYIMILLCLYILCRNCYNLYTILEVQDVSRKFEFCYIQGRIVHLNGICN